MWFFFLLGVIVFLIMEHEIIFWIMFVPLAIMLVVSIVKGFKVNGMGLKHFGTAMLILVVMVVVLMIVCIP